MRSIPHEASRSTRDEDAAAPRFALYRQDDNGNRIEMARFFTQREAEHQRDVFEARGHKQFYWVEPLD